MQGSENPEDEHDDEDELIRTSENGAMILDAKAEIEDIREMLGGKFNVEDHDEDAETIGGVIFSLLGRVPVKGELIEHSTLCAVPIRHQTGDWTPEFGPGHGHWWENPNAGEAIVTSSDVVDQETIDLDKPKMDM